MALSNKEIIEKFNEQVNMSAEEIEEWLKNPESRKAGTGVGLESGRMIIEILTRNPERDPGSYNEVRVLLGLPVEAGKGNKFSRRTSSI